MGTSINSTRISVSLKNSFRCYSNSIYNMSEYPTVKLNTGAEMPAFGLGTWNSKPNEVKVATETAIKAGYKHIDCAWIYGNEAEVGEGLKAAASKEHIFITSKLWNSCRKPEEVEPVYQETLKNLGIESCDLYLMHWPMAFKSGGEKMPMDDNNKIVPGDTPIKDSWQAMEKLYEEGKVKAIGVSNFNIDQMKELLSYAKVVPAMNQIENHVYLQQKELVDFCQSKGINITSYSPLGSPGWTGDRFPAPLKDETVGEIAKAHNVAPAQVLLRYNIQRGFVVIPKSVTPSRIEENIKCLSFKLTDEEMQKLAALDKGTQVRVCNFDIASHVPNYPFTGEQWLVEGK